MATLGKWGKESPRGRPPVTKASSQDTLVQGWDLYQQAHILFYASVSCIFPPKLEAELILICKASIMEQAGQVLRAPETKKPALCGEQ